MWCLLADREIKTKFYIQGTATPIFKNHDQRPRVNPFTWNEQLVGTGPTLSFSKARTQKAGGSSKNAI